MKGRGLFIALSFVTLLFISLFVAAIWLTLSPWMERIYPSLPKILGVIFLLAIVTVGATLLFIGIGIFKGSRHLELFRGIYLKLFYPVMTLLGKFIGIQRDKLHRILIDTNNLIVRSIPRTVKPERLLVLLPHCLQFNECKIRITGNVYNCAGCGKCKVKDLTELAKEEDLHIFVATGGSLARRIVEKERPQGIVAVACERELWTGLPDVYPLPVLAIINDRPYGPCFNTSVDIDTVKDALKFFIGK
ncbi:MAG: DUF116 domain-containing protein [Nitrospirota bacterium]